MGYYIYQKDCSFFISEKDYVKVCDDLSKKIGKRELNWIDNGQLIEACKNYNIEDVFDVCRWSIEEDVREEGPGIYNLFFEGEKLGDDYFIFKIIAPYVKSGSYIDMIGENRETWRWSFINGKIIEESGIVVYKSTPKYVVSCRWCSGTDSGFSIIGIEFDRDEAKNILKNAIEEKKKNSCIANFNLPMEIGNDTSWVCYQNGCLNDQFIEIKMECI